MSATCRRSDAGGFTLLEMIVVLALLGLIASLVGPSMLRGIDAWRRAAQVDAVIEQIRGLPARALAAGRAIEISQVAVDGPQPPLRAEEDWRLVVPATWSVHATGVCDGGQVQLVNEYTTRTIDVSAPFCEPLQQ